MRAMIFWLIVGVSATFISIVGASMLFFSFLLADNIAPDVMKSPFAGYLLVMLNFVALAVFGTWCGRIFKQPWFQDFVRRVGG